MADLFEIGKSGVQAYRRALGVTGQNIANANTEGYNRRDAQLSEVSATQGDILSISDQSGLGVRIENIRRAFDTLIVEKSNSANSSFENARAANEKLSSLEQLVLPGDYSLSTYMQNFFDGLNKVMQSPTDLGARQLLIEYGDQLADGIQNLANGLESLKNDLKAEAEIVVISANATVEGILEVQKKLISSGGSGASSNALLDQRDELINELSGFIGISVDYQERGAVEISLGQNHGKEKLLNLFTTQEIAVDPSAESLQFSLVNGSNVQATNQVNNGYLSGLSRASDAIDETISQLNSFVFSIVQDFNQVHASGVNLDGTLGSNMFSLQNFELSVEKNNISDFSVNLLDGELSKSYILSYNETSNSFVDLKSGSSFTYGEQIISVNDTLLKIDGVPADGDLIYVNASFNSAKNINFIIDRPEDIAAGASFTISTGMENQKSSLLSITGSQNPNPSGLPEIEEVFSNDLNISTARSFRNNLVSAIVGPNVSDLELLASNIQSNARFVLTDGDLAQLKSNPLIFTNSQSQNISFTLNSNRLPQWHDLNALVDQLNAGAIKGTSNNGGIESSISLLDLGLVASTNGSTLSFTKRADISSNIVSVQILNEPQINFTETVASTGEIYVFTRDGRQISGNALSLKKAEEIISEENGFFEQAEYRADYLKTGFLSTEAQIQTLDADYTISIPLSGRTDKYFSTTKTTNSLNANGFDIWLAGNNGSDIEQVFSLDPGLIASDIKNSINQDIIKLGYEASLNNLTRMTFANETTEISFSLRNLDGSYSDILANVYENDLTQVVARINLASAKTGVIAELTNDRTALTLSQTSGQDIILADVNSTAAGNGTSALSLQKLSSSGRQIGGEGAQIDLVNGQSVRMAGQLDLKSSRLFSYGISNYAAQAAPDFIRATQSTDQTSTYSKLVQSITGDQKTISFNINQDLLGTSTDDFFAKSAISDTVVDVQINDFATSIDVSNLPSLDGENLCKEILKEYRENSSARLVVEMSFAQPIPGGSDFFEINFEGVSYSGQIKFLENQDNLIETSKIVIDGPENERFSTSLFQNDDGTYLLKIGVNGGVPTAETMQVVETSANTVLQRLSISCTEDDIEALDVAATDLFDQTGELIDGKYVIETQTKEGLILRPDLSDSLIKISSIRAGLVDGNLSLYDLDGKFINSDLKFTSNVRQYIKLSNLPREELIVIFDNAKTSNFSASYSYDIDEPTPNRDFRVRAVEGNLGVFEVFDLATDQSVATRVANDAGEFTALGYKFKIDGVTASGDYFDVTHVTDAKANSDNVIRLLDLSQFDRATGQGEFNKIFKDMIATLGTNVKSSEITKNATQAAQQAILELKDEFSGVNLDTEAANLMEQQQAYQALARVLSTARDLLDTLMEVI